MTMVVFKEVAVIGVGLIGGSLALSARQKGIFGPDGDYGTKEDALKKQQRKASPVPIKKAE